MHCTPTIATNLLGLLLIALSVMSGCQETSRTASPSAKARSTAGSRENVAAAEGYMRQGMLDAALIAFEKALEENPRATQAHIGIGDIYEVKGDYQAAAQKYATAKAIEPGNFKAVYKLGLMYHFLQRLRDAINEYLAALAIDPNSFEANLNLATAYLQINEPALGLPYAQRAARLNPQSQPARANLGSIYMGLGQHEQAIDELRAAAELGDLNPQIAMTLADAFIKSGKPMRALNTLQVLARSSGDTYPAVYERLGYTYFKLNDFALSLEYYDKALAITPDEPSALNGKGVNLMTLYIRGDRKDLTLRDRAIASWQRSVQVKPDQKKIIDLIARYRKL